MGSQPAPSSILGGVPVADGVRGVDRTTRSIDPSTTADLGPRPVGLPATRRRHDRPQPRRRVYGVLAAALAALTLATTAIVVLGSGDDDLLVSKVGDDVESLVAGAPDSTPEPADGSAAAAGSVGPDRFSLDTDAIISGAAAERPGLVTGPAKGGDPSRPDRTTSSAELGTTASSVTAAGPSSSGPSSSGPSSSNRSTTSSGAGNTAQIGEVATTTARSTSTRRAGRVTTSSARQTASTERQTSSSARSTTTERTTSRPTTSRPSSTRPTTERTTTSRPTTTRQTTTTRRTTTQPPTTRPTTTTRPATTQPPTTQPTTTTRPTTTQTTAGGAGRLVWGDDFNSLDTSTWAVEHSTYGDGNNELQCYRPENVSVSGGKLILRARTETYTCPNGSTRQVTSGMVRSRGVTFSPGQAIEFRVKLNPADADDQGGLWPAVWASGWAGGGWPRGGEMDWLEVMTAENARRAMFSMHYADSSGRHALQNKGVIGSEYFSQRWHVVRFEYGYNGLLTWYLDGQQAFQVSSADTIQGYPAPFDQTVGEIKINLALGGRPGPLAPGAVGSTGASFEMDYIRIYQM